MDHMVELSENKRIIEALQAYFCQCPLLKEGKIGVDYLKIVVISYLFTTITFTFASGLRSIGNTRLPMLGN